MRGFRATPEAPARRTSVTPIRVAAALALVPAVASAQPATVVSLPLPPSTAIPEGGLHLAAFGTPNDGSQPVFFIARLDRKGLREIYRESKHVDGKYAWASSSTLIIIDQWPQGPDDAKLTKLEIAGSKVTRSELSIPSDEWLLVGGFAELAVTDNGEVWMGMCAVHYDNCSWVRVHGGARIQRSANPVSLHAASSNRFEVSSLASLAAPAGHSVKLSPTGFTCKAPGGKHVSPDDDGPRPDTSSDHRPKSLKWVVASPPLFAVTGVADIGGSTDFVEVWRACTKRPMRAFRLLRPRLWAENVARQGTQHAWEHEWQLWIDTTPIGTLAGSYELAISP
jgi:hypothetical protein